MKKEFTVDGKVYYVQSVTPAVQTEASRIYSKTFTKALSDGVQLRLQVEKFLQDKGLFNMEADEENRRQLRKEIRDKEVILRKGMRSNGTKMSKEDGRTLAFEIRSLRQKYDSIGSDISSLMNNTVESLANNAQMQYCIFASTFNEDGTRYWSTFETYQNDTENPIYTESIQAFITLIAGVDTVGKNINYEDSWLTKMGFMDDKGRFLRSDGKFVTESGKLVDETGRFIDEAGNYIDIWGYRIDKDGNLLEAEGWD